LTRALAAPDVLVMCGHGDYGPGADEHIRAVARRAREQGQYSDYLIYGNSTDARHRRKHNFLIGPAPAAACSFVNVLESSARRAVFLGNADTHAIFDACMDYFRPADRGKEFQFIREHQAGFAENVMAGKRALYGDEEPDAHTLLLNGDLPLFFYLEKTLHDADMADCDIILDANSRELQGGFLPREYHLRLDAPGADAGENSRKSRRLYYVKEANYFLLKLKFLTPALLDSVYGSRRIHDSSGGSYKQLLRRTYLTPLRAVPTLTVLLGHYASHNLLSALAGAPDNWIFHCRQVERMVDLALSSRGHRVRTRVKVTNRDPGAKKDLDSFGDWSYLNAMYYQAPEVFAEGFRAIYPHAPLLEDFAREMTPRLSSQIEIFADFPAYMNSEFRRFGLIEPYRSNRLDSFRSTLIDDQTIHEDLRFHRDFVESLPRNGS
jgi:hypothetical protein